MCPHRHAPAVPLRLCARTVDGAALRGFTLLELLVVISVIAVLASMVMTGVAIIRSNARSAVCKSNQWQLGIAYATYLGDNENYWVTDDWNLLLTPYLQNEGGKTTNVGVFSVAATYLPARCPATPKRTSAGAEMGLTYAYTAAYYDLGSTTDPLLHLFSWAKWAVPVQPRINDAQVRQPTSKVVLTEEWDDTTSTVGQASWGKSALNNMNLRRVHSAGSNVLCADGHVQFVKLPAVAMFAIYSGWWRDPMWLPYNPTKTTRL